jgi:hypothetical protein
MKNLKSLLSKRMVSSLKLVEILNALRDESEPRLRHDHFSRKVAKVLGKEESEKLIVRPPKGPGRTRTVYEFPMREACLMVMSYGYKLQAMMVDLMLSASKRN